MPEPHTLACSREEEQGTGQAVTGLSLVQSTGAQEGCTPASTGVQEYRATGGRRTRQLMMAEGRR
jgi:hypothetical protein